MDRSEYRLLPETPPDFEAAVLHRVGWNSYIDDSTGQVWYGTDAGVVSWQPPWAYILAQLFAPELASRHFPEPAPPFTLRPPRAPEAAAASSQDAPGGPPTSPSPTSLGPPPPSLPLLPTGGEQQPTAVWTSGSRDVQSRGRSWLGEPPSAPSLPEAPRQQPWLPPPPPGSPPPPTAQPTAVGTSGGIVTTLALRMQPQPHQPACCHTQVDWAGESWPDNLIRRVQPDSIVPDPDKLWNVWKMMDDTLFKNDKTGSDQLGKYTEANFDSFTWVNMSTKGYYRGVAAICNACGKWVCIEYRTDDPENQLAELRREWLSFFGCEYNTPGDRDAIPRVSSRKWFGQDAMGSSRSTTRQS